MQKIILDNREVTEIVEFVQKLGEWDLPGNVENPYTPSAEGLIRQMNLVRYLVSMKEQNPDVLLIGEAPGYLGAQLTGIPFTSEVIINKNPEYQLIIRPGVPSAEKTAHCVWNTCRALNVHPLFWNIFPFHPYLDSPKSNRNPNTLELEIGKEIFIAFLKLFPTIHHFLAVGRKAEKALKELGKATLYIRHPSYNGEGLFYQQLKTFYESLK